MTRQEVDTMYQEGRAGNIEMMYRLGRNYLYGKEDFPFDIRRGKFWLKKAAFAGHRPAARRLARLGRFFADYENCLIKDVPSSETDIWAKDPNRFALAMEYNLLSAYLGDEEALNYVIQNSGEQCNLNFPKENESLYDWLLGFVNCGNKIAPYLLGMICYEKALEIAKSPECTRLFEEAYEWFQLAADYDHAHSYYMLTKVIWGLDESDTKTLKENIPYWRRKATSLYDPDATYEYADSHYGRAMDQHYLYAALYGNLKAQDIVIRKNLNGYVQTGYCHYVTKEMILSRYFIFSDESQNMEENV